MEVDVRAVDPRRARGGRGRHPRRHAARDRRPRRDRRRRRSRPGTGRWRSWSGRDGWSGHAAALAGELGFALHDAATGGASDANTTAGMGVPTIDGLGPIGGLDHSPGEYLEVGSIVPRTALLAGLIAAIGRDPRSARGAAPASRRGLRSVRRVVVTRRRVSTGGPWEASAGYSRAIAVGDACFVSGTTDAGPDGASRHPGDAGGPGAGRVRDHRGRARRGRLRPRRRRPDPHVHRGSRRRGGRHGRPRRGVPRDPPARRPWWSSSRLITRQPPGRDRGRRPQGVTAGPA